MPNAPRFREPSSGGSPSLAVVRAHPSHLGIITGWCKHLGKSYHPDETIPGKSYRLTINTARVLYVPLFRRHEFSKNIVPWVGNGLGTGFLRLSYPGKIFPRYDGFSPGIVVTIDCFAVTIVIHNNGNINYSSCYRRTKSISRGERMHTFTLFSYFPDSNRTSGILS